MIAAAKKKPAKRKSTRKRKPKLLTIAEIAMAIGVSERTVNKYVARGCPKTSIDAVKAWRSENINAVVESAEPNELKLEQIKADLAKTLEQTRKEKLKNDVLSGQLVERVDVERDLQLAFARLVNRLTPLGTEIANLAPGELKATIKRTVDEKVRVALKELADGGIAG